MQNNLGEAKEANQPMQALLDRLIKAKINISPDFSGEFLRNGPQWFRGTHAMVGEMSVEMAVFGDFSRSISQSWTNQEGKKITHAQQETLNKYIEETRLKNRKEQEAAWIEARVAVQAEWDAASEIGESPYLSRKGFGNLFGCRLEPHARGCRTLVPARDISGELWGYQRIYSEKLSLAGTDKIFREGSRKEACFHTLGVLNESTTDLYIAEGIATAASIYSALEETRPVVSAFDAGNLSHVGRELRRKYPKVKIIFCADNDQFAAKDGKIYHTGKVKAERVAKEIGNASVVLPRFDAADLGTRPTDFNDLHKLYGLEEVKAQVMSAPEPGAVAQGSPAAGDKLTVGQMESRLVDYILDQFEGKLIRQGKDFFKYTGTHWEQMEPLTAPDYFKVLIDRASNQKLKFKDIASAYQRFFIHVPKVPHGVNMFSPNPLKQNFKNGTLELVPHSDGKFDITFHEHRADDYLIHCHDFAYQEDAPLNEEFEKTLDRIWLGEPDLEKKKQAFFEVMGACLISAFRKLVVFVGPPKSGKSTLILFAVNMVHEQYRCSVDPSLFQKFNLESMAGKLLNFDTDINLIRPITDSVLKKVEDRAPMRIERKGISDIYAPIPGMHLFGANRMPNSAEGGDAYDRRMLVFRCSKYQPQGDDYIQDFAQHVWRANPQGIIRRAIEGMKALCARGGHFTVPESSRAEIQAWKNSQGDVTQDFLMDISQGGVADKNNKLMMREDLKMERPVLFEIFKLWLLNNSLNSASKGKIKFYSRVRELGIVERKIEGLDYFLGIGNVAGGDSDV